MNANDFIRNCNEHTLEDLAPYVEHHVAWSLDGKRILAHAKELEDLLREVDRLGLKGGEYVGGYIPDPNIGFLGGGLNEGEVSV
jgi:hypothetical protein